MSLDKNMSLLKGCEKLICINVSAMYSLSKSFVSRVIKRKTQFICAFDYNATPNRKTFMLMWTRLG